MTMVTFVSKSNASSRQVSDTTFQIDHCMEISAIDPKQCDATMTTDCNVMTSSRDDPGYRHHTRFDLTNSTQSQQIVLHRKNRRLIQLEHAAHCTSDMCLISSCSKGKWLWKHMETCANNQCGTPHCFSSRTLLAHYSSCDQVYCNVCAPVRRHLLREQTKQQQYETNVYNGTDNITPNNNEHMLMMISEETSNSNSSIGSSSSIIKQHRKRNPSDDSDNRTILTSNVSRMKH